MAKPDDERSAQQQQFERETRDRQARLDRFDFALIHNLTNRSQRDLRPVEKSPHLEQPVPQTTEESEGQPRLAAESNIKELIHDIRMFQKGKKVGQVDNFLRRNLNELHITLQTTSDFIDQGGLYVSKLQEVITTLLILLDEVSQSEHQAVLNIDRTVIEPYLEKFAFSIYDRQRNKITPERRRELEAYAVIRELVDLVAFGVEDDIRVFITEFESYLSNKELFDSFQSVNLPIRALALHDLSCFLIEIPLIEDFATRYLQYNKPIQQALIDYIRTKIFAEIAKFIKAQLYPFEYQDKNATEVVQDLLPLLYRIQKITKWLQHRGLDDKASYWHDLRFNFTYEKKLILPSDLRARVLQLIPEEILWWRMRDAQDSEIFISVDTSNYDRATPQQRQYHLETRARQDRLPQASGVRIHNMKNRQHPQRLRRMEDNIVIENPVPEEKLASMSIESSLLTFQGIRSFFRYYLTHEQGEHTEDRLTDYLSRLQSALPKASLLLDTYSHLRRAPILRNHFLSLLLYLDSISTGSDQVALQPLKSILQPWTNKYLAELVLLKHNRVRQAEIDKENAFNTQFEQLGEKLKILIEHKTPEAMLAYLEKHEDTLTDSDILSRLKNRNTPSRLFVLLDLIAFMIGRERNRDFKEKYELIHEKVKRSIKQYIQQMLADLERDISFTLSQPNALELISQIFFHIERLGQISAWISERELNIGSRYWKHIIEVLRYPQVKLDINYRQLILVKLIEASTPLLSSKEKTRLEALRESPESDFVISPPSF